MPKSENKNDIAKDAVATPQIADFRKVMTEIDRLYLTCSQYLQPTSREDEKPFLQNPDIQAPSIIEGCKYDNDKPERPVCFLFGNNILDTDNPIFITSFRPNAADGASNSNHSINDADSSNKSTQNAMTSKK